MAALDQKEAERIVDDVVSDYLKALRNDLLPSPINTVLWKKCPGLTDRQARTLKTLACDRITRELERDRKLRAILYDNRTRVFFGNRSR